MGRITRAVSTYYETPDQSTPFAATMVRESRPTVSNEQPYHRETTLGSEWVRVDYGWVSDPSMVIIRNLDDKDVIEISLVVRDGKPLVDRPHLLLSPRDVFEGCPSSDTSIWVKSPVKSIRYSVTVLPK